MSVMSARHHEHDPQVNYVTVLLMLIYNMLNEIYIEIAFWYRFKVQNQTM